ncbi:MAG TPA: metal-dependent hydrolase [Pseudomonadales bacterium]|nr:metal-dependent hydrolase [Pseudomonadales bacterium]
MDSITQMALGAAVGEAVLGRRLGNRAPLLGAVVGTLPDLDVLVPLGDPVADFTYHRSASHSLIVLTLAAPLVAWLLTRIPRRVEGATAPFALWWLMVFLALVTHPLLDAFTVYGTQLLWPLDPTPVAWSTVFIIDPAYTLPLLVGVLGTLVLARPGRRGLELPRPWRLNAAGLVLSTLYLAWSLGAKLEIESQARASLAAQGVTYERLLSTPAPFNTLLWRFVVMDDEHWYEAFDSLLDGDPHLHLVAHETDEALLDSLAGHWPVTRLQWFTQGFYRAWRDGKDVLITDLRMGVDPNYVFSFRVGILDGAGTVVAADTQQRAMPIDTSRFPWLWARIWAADIDLTP